MVSLQRHMYNRQSAQVSYRLGGRSIPKHCRVAWHCSLSHLLSRFHVPLRQPQAGAEAAHMVCRGDRLHLLLELSCDELVAAPDVFNGDVCSHRLHLLEGARKAHLPAWPK